MDEILLFLAEKGALAGPVRATTVEAANSTSMSQQNASIRMRKLTREGMLERTAGGIRITGKGRGALASLHSRLRSILVRKRFSFTGVVIRGKDRAKYFISLSGYKEGIRRAVGFAPFPGTLNVEIGESQIEDRIALREQKGVRVAGFMHKGRKLGPVELYPCTISGHEGAVVFPYRSHHGLRVLELVSPHDLSGKEGFGEGSEVKVEIIFK